LNETITVSRTPAEAFRYIADFRSTEEWDATAFRARKLTPGPVQCGTQFEVDCKLPLGSVRIHYEVSELVPDTLIELRGRCALFTVVDRIQFSAVEQGTQVDYEAEFDYRGPLALFEQSMLPGMRAMGRKALAGMRRALENAFPAPQISAANARADALVVPGLALFSRLGYRRGRRHFNPISTDMRERHVLITGASAGLGLAAAQRLADMGAQLTLVMRNPDKAEKVREALTAESGNAHIAVEIADLALMRDVDALLSRLVRAGRPIDVLVNNAGALYNPRRETEEGLEASFALLLLSPYRLTLGLKPLLQAAAPGARVINVVSGGMYSQPLEVRKLIAREQNYSGSVAYARCKRALMVLTEQWAAAWAEQGIVVNAMHPGWADTPGVESSLPGFHRLTRAILRSPEEGADTIVWLAAAAEADKLSGKLFLDREPRTTHLRKSTQESPQEREKLAQFMAGFTEELKGGIKKAGPKSEGSAAA
jgi:NAD(P)-dependent dehydrogenase (short-subunit alcohol dehydrogenase family)